MKFICLQQDLLPSLQMAARSVGVHASLPVLENILLSAENKKLKIAATNLEIGVIKFINVEGLEDGQITVSAKTLLELVAGLKQIKLEFESDSNILKLKAGKLKASINGVSASEFPVIPLSEKGVDFKKEILLGCSQILFAAAVDEGRPILTGVFTSINSGKMDFVATDGFRLAHRQVNLKEAKSDLKVVIPKRTFEEVLRIMDEDLEDLDMITISPSPDQNQVVFKIGEVIVSSRLIEGNFPSWEKFIPQKFSTRALVDKEDLVKALKLASIFARSGSNIVTLKLEDNKINLESQAKEMGSQQNEVEAQVEGEALEIAFNPKFLLDAVSAVTSSQMMMEFSGSLSPTLIKPIGIEGIEYIVMPVRIS